VKTYVVGTAVRLSADLTLLATGALTDATMTIKVKTPDGTVTALTATRDAAGKFHADYLTAMLGLHRYEAIATGAAQAAAVGQFLVTQAVF